MGVDSQIFEFNPEIISSFICVFDTDIIWI